MDGQNGKKVQVRQLAPFLTASAARACAGRTGLCQWKCRQTGAWRNTSRTIRHNFAEPRRLLANVMCSDWFTIQWTRY